jgi:tetratricopeptide (TPR) repeat protein
MAAQRIKLPVAVAELEKRAVRDSADPAAHYNLAIGYWSQQKYGEAESSLRHALQLDQRLAAAHLAMHYLPFARDPRLWEDLYDSQARAESRAIIEAAQRHFKHAFLIDPLVDMTIAGASLPRKSSWWMADPELTRFYDAWIGGFDSFLLGRYMDAHTKLHRLREDFERNRFSGVVFKRSKNRIPDGLLWYHALAAAHIKQWDEAIGDVQTLIDRAARQEASDSLVHIPLGLSEYRYVLGTLLQQAGQLERAVELYQSALQQDAGLYMAHVQLAEIAKIRNDLGGEVTQRRSAVLANPEDPGLLVELGVALIRAREFAEAAAQLEQAVSMNAGDPRPLYPLGILYLQLGRYPEARQVFERYVALAPSKYEKFAADARARIARLPVP